MTALPAAWADLADAFPNLSLGRRLKGDCPSLPAARPSSPRPSGWKTRPSPTPIAETGADIRIATIDTGRLFGETHDVWAETEARYGRRIEAWYPDTAARRGAGRRAGCQRLPRVGRGPACLLPRPQGGARWPGSWRTATVWVTGLRAGQSAVRPRRPGSLRPDAAHGVIKVNPLLRLGP